jgi:hypothetical protein
MLEELCTMIIDIALLVSRVCDQFAVEFVQGYVTRTMERIVKESMIIRARLLHYFPPSTLLSANAISSKADDSWCGSHVNDDCLTGSTSALFVDESAPLPSSIAAPSNLYLPSVNLSTLLQVSTPSHEHLGS